MPFGLEILYSFLLPMLLLLLSDHRETNLRIMKMISHDLILSSLFIFFSFNTLSSAASEISYKDHCASVVSESTPQALSLDVDQFPFGHFRSGYYTGGDKILGGGSSRLRNSFSLRTTNIKSTDIRGLYKIEASLSFRSSLWDYSENFGYVGNWQYATASRPYRRGFTIFRLAGFWSEDSEKLCMVGTGTIYSKEGNSINSDAVFKLNNVGNSGNITSLVNGSLECLSSENVENYFEPISVLMLPSGQKYEYTLKSAESDNECSRGSDVGQSLSLDVLNFCPGQVSYPLTGLQLEYSNDCNSAKNCTPLGGNLPSSMSLEAIDCSAVQRRLRVLVKFANNSYEYQPFNPTKMLVGEGWWDEKKTRLCLVACHFLGTKESLASIHAGDCSVRLSLKVPAIWSINDTSSIVGQIWSNKTVKDSGYFKEIAFRNVEQFTKEVEGLKYQYSQQERVKKLCPAKSVKSHGNRYPSAYSSDLRFDMSVRGSHRRLAWGYSTPLSIGDKVYQLYSYSTYGNGYNSSSLVPSTSVNASSSGLYNISYKIVIYSNNTLEGKNSLFNMSSSTVQISAEGVYDAGTGSLCMVGCRNLASKEGTQASHFVDCKILVKFQFPPFDNSSGRYIEGSIKSTRETSDPLYFEPLDLFSAAFYIETSSEIVWRMDMEIIMVLMSTTLACVFVGLQLYYVKRHSYVLPFISLVMLSILTLGHMIPLVLNFEALFNQNSNSKNSVLRNVGWLEVNEITVRLIKMVAFLLQFRLLQLTWSARKADGNQKGIWISEKKAVYVTLPLYASGFLAALLLKWLNSSFGYSAYQQPSFWEDLKSYGGLVLDGFLLPQIILNLFLNLKEKALSCSFYLGITIVRLVPHAYDFYRTHSYVPQFSYYYADPSADFYSNAWDIVIPLGGLLFAVIIFLQQRFGGQFILPRRLKFKGSEDYEKVPVVAEEEAETEESGI